MTSQLWYCAVLTPAQAASGHIEAIRRRFAAAVRRAGAPPGACLFVTSHDTRAARLREDVADRAPVEADCVFFSPASISAIPGLLSKYDARPSGAPDRARAALLVGRTDDWDLLPRASH